jgi:dCMP deaminase
MEIAMLFAKRGTCPRAEVGVVAVRENRLLGGGYNSAPAGMIHCEDAGCDIAPDGGCRRAIHAEAGLIAWAAREGISLAGAELFCTHAPCTRCAQLIVSAGIIGVNYNIEYRDSSGLELLARSINVGVKSYAPAPA